MDLSLSRSNAATGIQMQAVCWGDIRAKNGMGGHETGSLEQLQKE